MPPKKPFSAYSLLGALLAVACLGLWACGDEPPAQSVEVRPESFTFLEMGVNTPLTEALQDGLTEHLGSAAVEKRGLLNLDQAFSFRNFLGRHLSALSDLNRHLNPPSGERREHGILRLAYNYPSRQTPAFNRVRLVFSQSTRRPLVFRVHANQAGAGILAALTEKYGSPQVEEGGAEAESRIRLWQKNGDALTVISSLDRFGEPEYRIAFYFTENIRDLVAAEKAAAARAEKARRQAGKSAF